LVLPRARVLVQGRPQASPCRCPGCESDQSLDQYRAFRTGLGLAQCRVCQTDPDRTLRQVSPGRCRVYGWGLARRQECRTDQGLLQASRMDLRLGRRGQPSP